MSSNLTAEPIIRPKLQLGTDLKFILRSHLGEPVNSIIDENFILFLKAVALAGSKEAAKDANSLIEFITKHGQVDLTETY